MLKLYTFLLLKTRQRRELIDLLCTELEHAELRIWNLLSSISHFKHFWRRGKKNILQLSSPEIDVPVAVRRGNMRFFSLVCCKLHFSSPTIDFCSTNVLEAFAYALLLQQPRRASPITSLVASLLWRFRYSVFSSSSWLCFCHWEEDSG
jgi:hypothetical protein